jgi:hypothetical protein
MFQYFLKESTLQAFKESTLTNALNVLINTLKTCHPNLELTYIEPVGDSHPKYNVSLYGVVLYTITHRPHHIRIERNGNGYDGFEFDTFYKTNEIGFVTYVENRDVLRDVIDNKIDYMNKNIMYVYTQIVARDYNEPRGKLGVNCNSTDGATVGFGLTVDSTLVDSRFVPVYGKECEVYEWEDIPSDSTPEQVRECIELVISRAKAKINALYARYENMKETIGGVTINLDNKIILCHRGFKPLITGGFITYKCPYTMDLISVKYNTVTVTGLDEVYGNSIVLIGHNY